MLGPPVEGADWLAADGPSNDEDNHHRRGVVILDGRAVDSRRLRARRLNFFTACSPRAGVRGLATEASQALLTWLWKEKAFQRVYARTDMPNLRSAAVMRRLGMHFESATPTIVIYVLERVTARDCGV